MLAPPQNEILTNYGQDLYEGNYITLMTEIKEELNK